MKRRASRHRNVGVVHEFNFPAASTAAVERRRTDLRTDAEGPVALERGGFEQLDLFEPMTIWEFAEALANAPKLTELPRGEAARSLKSRSPAAVKKLEARVTNGKHDALPTAKFLEAVQQSL